VVVDLVVVDLVVWIWWWWFGGFLVREAHNNKRILSIHELKNSLWIVGSGKFFMTISIRYFFMANCLMPGFTPLKEPWQISFILNNNNPEKLAPLHLLIKKAYQNAITFGYFFTQESLACSADVFPLELLHISKRNEVLLGEPPLSAFTPDRKALRLQCERELRGLLVHLRREFVYMDRPYQDGFAFLS
jgi:hypothetical protein